MNIRVLGLGNVLMSDDGFGPYVVRVLEALYELPAHVRVIDAGTPGLDLTPYLLDADVVILVDTLATPGTPGDVHVRRLPDMVHDAPDVHVSAHDADLKAALASAAAGSAAPGDVVLLGVVPEWIATGVCLTRPVRAAIAPTIGLILGELDRLGAAPAMRAVPRQPDTWWERESDHEIAAAAV